LFRKEQVDASNDKVNTVIGKGTHFKGSITSNGIVRVDGEMEGEINTQGNVIVGENGKVKAGVKAKNVAVAGNIEGNVEAEGKTEIKGTGVLAGDIKTNGLAIDDGAVFTGSCEMKTKDEALPGKKGNDYAPAKNVNKDVQQGEPKTGGLSKK